MEEARRGWRGGASMPLEQGDVPGGQVRIDFFAGSSRSRGGRLRPQKKVYTLVYTISTIVPPPSNACHSIFFLLFYLVLAAIKKAFNTYCVVILFFNCRESLEFNSHLGILPPLPELYFPRVL